MAGLGDRSDVRASAADLPFIGWQGGGFKPGIHSLAKHYPQAELIPVYLENLNHHLTERPKRFARC